MISEENKLYNQLKSFRDKEVGISLQIQLTLVKKRKKFYIKKISNLIYK